MKIEEQKIPTFNVGRKETAVASIQASAKAFEILSSGLYSDSEFAIVREIAANAWDSHKAAGCTDVPFKVQIPNDLDPRFCVRDYGIGMDHQFMMTRVNTYFDSTKSGSNDEIGGFGLGIKSVFSYASSFMITCYKDGMRRVYVYQIGESGLPEISLMAETETDEQNGVEVSIPVKREDYSKFSLAAQKTFAFYVVKPEIGGVNLAIPEFSKIIETDQWFICKTQQVFNKVAYVEMGGIAYPIEGDISGLRSYYSSQHTLFIKAGIGEVDITPNREQIKLTERTRKFIAARVEQIKDEAFSIIQDRIDAMALTYYWTFAAEACKYDFDLLRSLGVSKDDLKFNGQKFDGHFRLRIASKAAPENPLDPNSPMKQPVLTAEMVEHVTRFGEWSLHESGRVKKEEQDFRYEASRTFDRFVKPNTVIITDEISARHIAPWMRFSDTGRIVIIRVEQGQAASVVTAVKEKLQGFTEVFDAAGLVYEKPARKTAGERKYYIYHTSSWGDIERTEMDLTALPETTYYLLTDGRQRGDIYGRTGVDFKNESQFLSTARSWLDGASRIYFLTEAMLKKIDKVAPDVTMVELSAKIESVLPEKIKDAAQNYVSRNLDDIKEPFMRSNSSWRAASALDFWAKEFSLSDYGQAQIDLQSHKPDAALEKMVKLVMKKSIFEMFAEYGVATKEVTAPSFDELLAKMPYIYAMVDDHADEEVVKHIAETMGWVRKVADVTI